VAEVSGGLWTTSGDMVVGSGGTGTLTMTGGRVQVEGTLYKGLGGTINLNAGGTLEIGAGGSSGALGTDLINNGGVVFNRSNDSTLSNSISGAGSLTKIGSGTLIIGSSNSYTGNTLINGGVLSLENTDALGSVGTLSFAGGTLQFTTDNATDYSSRLSSSGNQAIALDTNYETVTFATGISGAGTTLDKLGFGTLILAGDNTFSGPTTISVGTLRIGDGSTTGSLAGDVVNNGSLVFNRSDAVTYAGNISGLGSLETIGAGRVELSGVNSFLGGTKIDGGVLAVGSADALGNSGTISFGGGTLQYTAANTTDYSGRFSSVAGQAYSIDTNGQAVTFAQDLASSGGSLAKFGVGSLTLSGSNDLSGGVAINDGLLILGGADALGSSSSTIAFGGGVLEFTDSNNVDYSGRFSTADNQVFRINTAGATPVVFNSGITSSGGSLEKSGAGTLTLSGSNSLSGGFLLGGGVLSLGNAGALGDSGGIDFRGGTLQFSSANTADYSARFSTAANEAFSIDTNGQLVTLATGLASSRGTLEKLGAGTLTLAGDSTYSGLTTISGGTLQIGSGATSGSVAGNIANNAALVFNRSDAVGYAGDIAGTGLLRTIGSGTLSLEGNNTYSGGTQINGGVLSLGSADALGPSGTISFGGGTLQFTASGTTDYSARFSTAGNQAFVLDTNGEAVALASARQGSTAPIGPQRLQHQTPLPSRPPLSRRWALAQR
jgi:autotransporter-associated beta strand protein